MTQGVVAWRVSLASGRVTVFTPVAVWALVVHTGPWWGRLGPRLGRVSLCPAAHAAMANFGQMRCGRSEGMPRVQGRSSFGVQAVDREQVLFIFRSHGCPGSWTMPPLYIAGHGLVVLAG